MEEMSVEAEALEYYRKLVSLIYREVGSMLPKNHRKLYEKSKIGASNLGATRKQDTKRFYHKSKSDNAVGLIDQHYVEWSGLTPEDVLSVFEDGDWRLGSEHYSFGGPKWAGVTETALSLREAILREEWRRIPELIDAVKSLHHNNGMVVDKFKELGT